MRQKAQENLIIRAELSGSETCSALDFTTQCTAPVLAMCRELLAAGVDPDATLVVYRRGTLALRIRSIREGAALEVNARGTDFVPRAVRTAPPVRCEGISDPGIGIPGFAKSESPQ